MRADRLSRPTATSSGSCLASLRVDASQCRRLVDDGWFLLAKLRSSMAKSAGAEQALEERKQEIRCKGEGRDDERRPDDAVQEVGRLVEDDVAERAAADDAG